MTSIKIKLESLYVDTKPYEEQLNKQTRRGDRSKTVGYFKEGHRFGTAFFEVTGNGRTETFNVDKVNEEVEIDLDSFIKKAPSGPSYTYIPKYDFNKEYPHVNYGFKMPLTREERLLKVEQKLGEICGKIWKLKYGP